MFNWNCKFCKWIVTATVLIYITQITLLNAVILITMVIHNWSLFPHLCGASESYSIGTCFHANPSLLRCVSRSELPEKWTAGQMRGYRVYSRSTTTSTMRCLFGFLKSIDMGWLQRTTNWVVAIAGRLLSQVIFCSVNEIASKREQSDI